MTLTKEQILAADDLKRIPVDVPEWGGKVYVTELTGAERGQFEMLMVGSDGKAKPIGEYLPIMKAQLVGRTLVNETGERIFTNEEVDALAKKNSQVLERIFKVAEKLNSVLGMEDVAKN